MPTINQLPATAQVSSADELPLSQGGVTRSVSVGTLLATTQPVITIASTTMLGRVSLGTGGPEPVTLGAGLAMAAGAVAATGGDHAGFAPQGELTLSDEIILNSDGQPRRMPVGKLLGLYTAGGNITIDATGIIAAAVSTGGVATSISTDPVTATIAPTDLIGISQGGQDHAIPLGAMLHGTDQSAMRITPTGRPVGSIAADLPARHIDPRDFAANMFSGATSQDDAVGIQAAIAYAQASGGGVIQLPDHGGVKGQLATPLTITKSGVSLIGQTRSLLTHDNLGPLPDAAVQLRWVGPAGAAMLRIAPVGDIINGTPLSGCDINGILFDCAGLAAIGVILASAEYCKINLMVTEATADGVLLDTVDLGEFNDCQNNDITLGIRILTTLGNCLRLAGSARATQLGCSSYNAFRRVILTHNAGDALVLDYAENNLFDKVMIRNRPSFTQTLGTAGTGRAIVLKGSSESVQRPTGNVQLVGANNNVINQLSCAGSIASLGQQSGFTSPASQNRILRFDSSANVLNLVTEIGASIQVATTDNVDLSLAASRGSFANVAAQAARLRDERGPEALAVSSTTGDHVQFYAGDAKTWGLGIDSVTNDLRFTPSLPTTGQLNLGSGQGAYGLAALGVGARLPSGASPGVLYLADAGTAAVSAPASGLALYVKTGALYAVGSTGAITAVGAPGAAGVNGPAWSPPKRIATGLTDTPTIADDQGVIAYSNAQPVTVTVNDLGSLRVYDTLQIATGSITLLPGNGVTMLSQGKAVASVVSAYQGAAISVISSGSGLVFVVGNTQ